MERQGEQVRVRDWTVSLYYLPRCPSERADRSGWYAFAENDSGVMVPPSPSPDARRSEAQKTFDRLMSIIL
jgi:hypothetical protein